MPKLYIMRGLPGSGKSTKAKEIYDSYSFVPNVTRHGPNGESEGIKRIHICSTDSYFIRNGIYKFDAAKLGLYHEQNLHDVINWMDLGDDVIVDNTNIRRQDFQKYITAANQHSYEVIEIVIGEFTPDACAIYHARNKHGVPLSSILRMASKWEP